MERVRCVHPEIFARKSSDLQTPSAALLVEMLDDLLDVLRKRSSRDSDPPSV